MKIWKNTKTIDEFIPDLSITSNKHEADVALLGGKKISLDDFSSLKGIFKCGVGTDNVPFGEAEKRNIKIGLPSEKTAEYIFEETACFACHLCLKMLYSEAGSIKEWNKVSREFIRNKILLIIGTGKIGKRVAEKMSNFMEIKTFDISNNSLDELTQLIATADCISLHIPLTEATRDFIDSKKLAYMKNRSIIINTSRGGIVNEDALYKELKNNRIKAAFDVFWKEPYKGKLSTLPNATFSMTPHIASTNKSFVKYTAEDFRKFLKELNCD